MPALFKKHKSLILVLFPTLIFIVGAWLYLGWFLTGNFAVTTLDNWGVLGDSFNIITSLFTGLAFAGVIVSVMLQTKELELQRKELQETREELRGQKEQLKKQQQEMVSQSFDNKFFQMLNMFNTNVENFSAYGSAKEEYVKGKFAIRAVLYRLNYNIPRFDKNFKIPIKAWDNATVNTYCISLYQILKYTDENTPNKKEAKRYTNIIRAQLSIDELMLLVYNKIWVIKFSDTDGTKFKELLEKYAFFEYLGIGTILLSHTDLLATYDKKVAGKNTPLKEKIEELQSKIKNQGTK